MSTHIFVLDKHHKGEDSAKLEALREAARAGFDDLDEGRFKDIPSENLGDFIAGIGLRAKIGINNKGP